MKRGFVQEDHVVVYCDECGDVYTDSAGESICFESTHQAAAHFAEGRDGWLYDGDRIICDGCRWTAECTARGHRFVTIRRSIGRYGEATLATRICERCGTAQSNKENDQ